MDVLIVAATAFAASALTLYSGFGLGTILLPAFALFFPVETAVAATAIVHLLNNLFKGGLLGRKADWPTVLRFGLPAVPAAAAGAWLLAWLGRTETVFTWQAMGRNFGPTAAGLAVGGLMILFALLELHPRFRALRAPRRALVPGGAVTGFLGGLTGQQGALRSIFLLKTGLDPARFVATGVLIAILVDLARLAAYAATFSADSLPAPGRPWLLIGVGVAAATLGAWIAVRRLEKVTIGFVRGMVAALMLGIGAAIAAGLIGA
ncbi:MAG: sulfite exporter TauE/SafE family protein [Allosphingosinicella sp.]